MRYFEEAELVALAKDESRLRDVRALLLETACATTAQSFDVFLSHSSAEPDEILFGVMRVLESSGLTVYVDWYSDPHLDPKSVDKNTASLLRTRMRASKSLLYVYSRHSQKSRWMPWELGYFDGFRGRVGVFPVTRNQDEAFKREEYLQLYPYVDVTPLGTLWINSNEKYGKLTEWISAEIDV